MLSRSNKTLSRSNKEPKMSIAVEMQSIVRMAAEPWLPGDAVKSGINRAARRLGIGYRRATSFWYGTAHSVRADEADQLRAARREMLTQRMRRLEDERDLIRQKLAALEQSNADMARALDGNAMDLARQNGAGAGR